MAEKESIYLPRLEPCLRGDRYLLSWHDAYSTLCDQILQERRKRQAGDGVTPWGSSETLSELAEFFTDSAARRILYRHLEPFSPSSPDSKELFENLTSPINVTPRENGPYDINQIKQDAVWLASESKVDHVTALRIVVLEWQSRARARLLSIEPAAESQPLEEGMFGKTLKGSTFLPRSSLLAGVQLPGQRNKTFNSVDERRARILRLYLSEHLHILRVALVLIQNQYEYRLSNPQSGRQLPPIVKVGMDFVAAVCPGIETTNESFLRSYVEALQQRINRTQAGSGWYAADGGDEKLDADWLEHQFLEMVAILQMMLQFLGYTVPSTASAIGYFTLMRQQRFFHFQPVIASEATLALLSVMSSLVSMAFFARRDDRLLRSIADEAADGNPIQALFTQDHTLLCEINEILKWAVDEELRFIGMPVYAWVAFVTKWARMNANLIANNTASAPGQQANYDFTKTENLKELASRAVDHYKFFDLVPESLAILRASFRDSVHEITEVHVTTQFLALIRFSLEDSIVEYGPELINGVLAILDADRSYWDFHENPHFHGISGFVPAHSGLRAVLILARDRFPLEAGPYAMLLKAILLSGDMAYEQLDAFLTDQLACDSFTERLHTNFRSYEVDEVDMPDADRIFVRLTADLPVFLSDSRTVVTEYDGEESHALVPANSSPWRVTQAIESQTRGEVRDDSQKPLIIAWEHEFNPLEYLTDTLAIAAPGSNHIRFPSMITPSPEEVVDIISFLNAVLLALWHCRGPSRSKEEAERTARRVLGRRFNDSDSEKDLIAVIYDIFEFHIQEQRDPIDGVSSVEVLTRCIQFFHAASLYLPGRIWPLLARSGLLGLDGRDCGLANIVTAIEMIAGRYGFLLSCLRLFDALIDLSFTHRSTNTSNGSRALSRLAAEAETPSFHVPVKTIRSVITGFLRTLVPVFESCRNWRYASPTEQFEINTWLLKTFEKILKVTYGYDDNPDVDKKFTAVLAESAAILVGLFLSTPSQPQLSSQLVEPLSRPLQPPLLGFGRDFQISLAETEAALKLCTSLLHIEIFVDGPTSSLEVQLFSKAPTLARLFATSDVLKSSVAALMDALLTASMKHISPPPSLLGHMGSDTAKSFLAVLTQVNDPIENVERALNVWRLLSTVVSSQQQWFALYLLNGRAPREGLSLRSDAGNTNGAGRVVLSYALDRLSSIATVPYQKLAISLEMLKFVALSYNHWPLAVNEIRAHRSFIVSLSDYFGRLRREDTTPVKIYMEAAIAAVIAEMLSMHLHTSRQLGDIDPALELVNKLGYLKRFGFEAPEYNPNRLQENIQSVFPGLRGSQFKHTLVFPVEYGDNYFYDTPLALRCMEASPGHRQLDPSGLIGDLKTENIMLSKVDAQMLLHSKCKLLATELAQFLAKDSRLVLVDPLVDVVKQCLGELPDASLLPTTVLDNFTKSRIELCLLLFQKLIVIQDGAKLQDVAALFADVWDVCRSLIPEFDSVYTSDKVDMNRQLLRILFLSLQPLTAQAPRTPRQKGTQQHALRNVPPEISALLLQVLADVVTRGFKSVAAILHENLTACEPSDFALIIAILQTILKIPGADLLYAQIALEFANSSLHQYAARLFSWSDQLLVDGDPIYGEHSILFLLELSSIPKMAETLATGGILSQLSSANLMGGLLRPNGVGPFDNPVRLHSIWARGVLPLCLNLLDAVGPPLAGEVVSFLNQYPNQLQRLVRSLANRRAPTGTRPGDSHMTLNMAAETHSLALIWLVVERYRAAGSATGAFVSEIPALDWDKASVNEDVDDWLQGRAALRSRIVPANDRESELSRLRPADPTSRTDNRLEEKIWEELSGALECFSAVVEG